MANKRLRTPLIKPRQQGGTFYTFASALEDVGLNINELRNKVSLSHYVLLNIPAFDSSTSFSDLEDVNQGDYIFAQDFQSYVLNMETLLRNQENYNFADSLTVSERVFWKYLEKTKAVTFVDDLDDKGNPTGYFVDDNNCVQAFGAITAGSQRSDSYGLYNETFVQIPSSYGKMKVLFKNVDDRNFYRHKFYTDSSSDLIEYLQEDEVNDAGRLHTGLSGKASFDGIDNGVGYYEIAEDEHRACVEFSLSELRKYYNDSTLSYDDIAISHSIDSSVYDDTDSSISASDSSSYYEFNSVLVYYSIYDSTGKNIIATNAYGLLILDNAVNESQNTYKFPILTKKKSTLDDIGNSYSFRLNIKTTSVYNGDILVNDNSTAAYSMSEDFNDMIRNLGNAVEILRSNANAVSLMATESITIKNLISQSLDKIDDIEKTINAMKKGYLRKLKVNTVEASQIKTHTIDSSTIFADVSTGETVGSLDSSIFNFKNIKATNSISSPSARFENLNVKKFTIDEDDFLVGSEEENSVYSRMNANGIYTVGDVFVADESSRLFEGETVKDEIDSTTVSSLLENIAIYQDGTISLPEKTKIEQEVINAKYGSEDQASDDEVNEVKTNITSLFELLSQESFDKKYINLSILVGCLLHEIKNMQENYNTLPEKVSTLVYEILDSSNNS